MNVGSLFSGIGGLDEGLRCAGHQHVFFCESDPYRRDVLRARFPGVPVYEDVHALPDAHAGRGGGGVVRGEGADGCAAGSVGQQDAATGIDLLCGGFPCQDLSVAGKRAGLAGDRSGLFFEFARIADAFRPGWLLVENVPGLLSSNGGRDFGVVLGTLADLGYGVAWRILDSRFFGVPQRRRRVFIVGALADGDPRAAAERAGEVLAVGQGCVRHLASRGEARPNVASPLGGSVGKGRGHDGNPFDRGGHSSLSGMGSGGPDDNDAQAGRLVVANTLKSQGGRGWSHDAETLVAETLREHPRPGSNSNGQIVPVVPISGDALRGEGTAKTPSADAEGKVRLRDPGLGIGEEGDPAFTLSATSPGAVGVRRLTPTECERLQGFGDGWTQLGETPDSRRYSALGDAVTVNVSEWIGRRLAA